MLYLTFTGNEGIVIKGSLANFHVLGNRIVKNSPDDQSNSRYFINMTTTPIIPAVSAGLGGLMAQFKDVGNDILQAAPVAMRGSYAAHNKGASISNQARHHSLQQSIGGLGGK